MFTLQDGPLPLLLDPDFLDAGSCAQLRAAIDRGTSGAAEIVESEVVARERIRRTRSVEIEPEWLAVVETRLDRVRGELESGLGRPLGRREGTGFLRYQPGGFYRPHRDRGDVAGWRPAAWRAVALVLFLNGHRDASGRGDFDGGRLRLYPDGGDAPVDVVPRTGLLAAFPAEVLHEVLPVRAGIRDAAVDWFYDRTAPPAD